MGKSYRLSPLNIFSFQSAKSAKRVKTAKLPKSANLLHKTAKSAKSLWIKSAALKARETWDRRQEMWDSRQETGDGRREAGDRRQDTGDRIQKTGDRIQETGDRWKTQKTGEGRWERVLRLPEKFSAINLAAEFIKFLRPLIANRKCILAVAAKSAKWGYIFLKQFFGSMKNLADVAVLANDKLSAINYLVLLGNTPHCKISAQNL